MYAGQLVEFSDAYGLFGEPLHPYSRELMASVPTLKEKKELQYLPGQPPSLLRPPEGTGLPSGVLMPLKSAVRSRRCWK